MFMLQSGEGEVDDDSHYLYLLHYRAGGERLPVTHIIYLLCLCYIAVRERLLTTHIIYNVYVTERGRRGC